MMNVYEQLWNMLEHCGRVEGVQIHGACGVIDVSSTVTAVADWTVWQDLQQAAVTVDSGDLTWWSRHDFDAQSCGDSQPR